MILDPKNEQDLEEIKEAIREDFSDDNTGIKRSAAAAIAYIKGAIGQDKPSFYETDNDYTDLLNLSILMLTDHYYHARSATIVTANAAGGLGAQDLGLHPLILHLHPRSRV
ncbi:phage gp6-like head-tail connector protein, partial [Bacillus thuringiensis]|nr:phage gp6-like head-tail connector protein [Bacillus thuringiensis]